jgi:hypothetical protein
VFIRLGALGVRVQGVEVKIQGLGCRITHALEALEDSSTFFSLLEASRV